MSLFFTILNVYVLVRIEYTITLYKNGIKKTLRILFPPMTDLMFHCAIRNFRISNSFPLPCCFSSDFPLFFSIYMSISLPKYTNERTKKKKSFTSSTYNILEIFGWNFVFKSCPSLYTFF